MTMHHPKPAEIVRRDPRYAYEAYEFVFAALTHTQKRLGRVPPEDVSGEAQHQVRGGPVVDGRYR